MLVRVKRTSVFDIPEMSAQEADEFLARLSHDTTGKTLIFEGKPITYVSLVDLEVTIDADHPEHST